MNTLFIIGNGFDLAHGLETRYEDFLFWLLKKELIEALENHSGEQNYTTKTNQVFHSFTISSQFDTNSKDVFKTTVTTQLNTYNKLNDIKKDFIDETHTFEKLNFKNRIIKSSIDNYDSANWSDLEWQYFRLISSNQYEVQSLNEDLEFIRTELSKYLDSAQRTVVCTTALVSKFQNIFKNEAGAENLIATFNYTNTLSKYYQNLDFENVQIHGDLNKSILGYGDETTEQYKILEDQNNFEYIKFMKSSQYKRDDAYDKIHLFINQQVPKFAITVGADTHDPIPYKVVVLGHSCGLSDRVLLKEIFEKPACSKIRVYHFEGANKNTDFFHTLSNISRHFQNKIDMRSKVEFYDSKYIMPQWNY